MTVRANLDLKDGKETFQCLPRVIRSCLIRDFLRVVQGKRVNDYSYSKSLLGLRVTLINRPSGRFLTHWLHEARGDLSEVCSTYEEEKAILEEIAKRVVKQGWAYTTVTPLSNSVGSIGLYYLTSEGKTILDRWESGRAKLLGHMILAST